MVVCFAIFHNQKALDTYRNPLKTRKKKHKKGHRNKNSVLLAKRGSLPEAKEWLEDDCDNLVME